MAGIASNFAVALEVLLVDGHHHANHFARGQFGLFVVFFHPVRHMAIFALDAQRSGDELHRRDDLLGGNSFERLDVFVFFFGELGGLCRCVF